MDVTEKRGRHACNVCSKFFTRPVGVQRHMQSVHNKEKHDCRFCGLKYASASGLRSHIVSVHEAKCFRCGLCDHVFSYSSSLGRHLTKVHPGVRSAISVVSPTEDIPPIVPHDCLTTPISVLEQLPPALNIDVELVAPTPETIPDGMSPKVPVSPPMLVQEQLVPATNIEAAVKAPMTALSEAGNVASVIEQLPSALNMDVEIAAPTPAEDIPDGVSPKVPLSTPMLVQEQLVPATNIDDAIKTPTTALSDTGDVPIQPTTLVDKYTLPDSSTTAPSVSKAKRPRRLSDAATIQDLPSDVRKVYTDNWDAIRTHNRIGIYMSTYTVFQRPTENGTPDWFSLLRPIFNAQTRCFKINFGHHFILRNQETQELRFYHSSHNNSAVLEIPAQITNKKDFDRFIDSVAASQPFEYAHHYRPSTSWLVESIPATSFYLYHMDFSLV